MTTTKADAEAKMKNKEATTTAVKVQLPHDCKVRLDELTRLLKFKSLGSTVEFILPTTQGAITMEKLARAMGYDNCGQTIDWLLQQASPAIAAITGTNPASTGTAGHPAVSMHAPSFPTPPFSQNPPGVTPITFTPRGGLGGDTTITPRATGGAPGVEGDSSTWYSNICTPTAGATEGVGGSTTWYYSNRYTSSRTPVQSNTMPVTEYHSDPPIPNSFFHGFAGGSGGQYEIKEDGQFQRGSMSSNSMYNSVGMRQLMSQISTLQGKSQQASLENIQSHNKERRRKQVRDKTQEKRVACTGNIDGPAVGKGTGISTPTQHSVNSHPNYNAASDWRIIMDQLQAPSQVNQLLSQGSTFFHELGGTCNAQNHSRAMQLHVQNGGTAPNNANHMSSWTPNPNPAQDILNEVQAPAHHYWTERRIGRHDPNVVHNYYNRGQLTSTLFPIDLRGIGETHMTGLAGLPLMRNQVLETRGAGVQNDSQSQLNGGRPVAGFNDTHFHQENDNPVQQSGKALKESDDEDGYL